MGTKGNRYSIRFGVARNCWLRSPNPSNANNERNVNDSGALNNNNANNTNGVVAGLCIG